MSSNAKRKTKYNTVQQITVSALLIAIGIIIPIFSPLKIVLEPASFTLASHVPIFIGMMISPMVAVAVELGTTLGFFLGGFQPVIVMRALSQIVFVLIGSFVLKRYPKLLHQPVRLRIFSLVIGVVHGACEMIVVFAFFFSGSVTTWSIGSILLLVGLGTVIHSMIDFEIAYWIIRALNKIPGFYCLA